MKTASYKLGSERALQSLGIIKLNSDTLERIPFPSQNDNITAERLAKTLQQEGGECDVEISPDNQKFDRWERPVVWSAPQRISDDMPNPGLYTPHSPRS